MSIIQPIFKAMVGSATHYLCDFAQILNFYKLQFLLFKVCIIISFDKGIIKITMTCKVLAQRLTLSKI